MHYDLCFVHDAKLAESPAILPWFSRLEFVEIRKLKADKLGVNKAT